MDGEADTLYQLGVGYLVADPDTLHIEHNLRRVVAMLRQLTLPSRG